MVVAIAAPTSLAYISTPLLGVVDTAVVGQLGDAALLGGLAVGAVLFDIIFTTFNFLRSSTTALVAQALGAHDSEGQRTVLVRALTLSVLVGLVTLLAAPLLLHFGLIAMGVTPDVEKATRAYFNIRVMAAPLTLMNYAVLGWLLGRAQARLGLLLQTILNGTNIALSIILGLHLGWGIEGVGWATVIAEAVAAVVGLTIAWLTYRGAGRIDWHRILNRAALKRLFGVNRDIMIRSFCLLFAFGFFTAQGAQFGETILAANAVLMNFFLISAYFLDGFATAAEQLAGRALGARYRPALDRAAKLTLIWGFVLAGFAALASMTFGSNVIDFLTTNEAVRETAKTYLIWAALSAIVGVAAFQMDGIFLGATWSRDVRDMMLVSVVIYLGVWWVVVPLLGNHGLWLALEVFLGVRGITLWARLAGRARQSFPDEVTAR